MMLARSPASMAMAASSDAAVSTPGCDHAALRVMTILRRPGSAQIFSEALAVADEMIVTHIDHAFVCDTFFPAIDPALWHETAHDSHASEYDYAFVTYQRT